MDEIEPVASTSTTQQHIPNGSISHVRIKTPPTPIDMNKIHGIVEKGVVEAYVEFHAEPQDNKSLEKEEIVVVERPKSADQPTKNHIVKRINNKVSF